MKKDLKNFRINLSTSDVVRDIPPRAKSALISYLKGAGFKEFNSEEDDNWILPIDYIGDFESVADFYINFLLDTNIFECTFSDMLMGVIGEENILLEELGESVSLGTILNNCCLEYDTKLCDYICSEDTDFKDIGEYFLQNNLELLNDRTEYFYYLFLCETINWDNLTKEFIKDCLDLNNDFLVIPRKGRLYVFLRPRGIMIERYFKNTGEPK